MGITGRHLMGTTGRFGGSGGLTSRGGHQWYDTDYSELYIGLAVVLGFFILLVIFLIILFTIIYIRRKYCLKQSRSDGQKRQQNIITATNNEGNTHTRGDTKLSMIGNKLGD